MYIPKTLDRKSVDMKSGVVANSQRKRNAKVSLLRWLNRYIAWSNSLNYNVHRRNGHIPTTRWKWANPADLTCLTRVLNGFCLDLSLTDGKSSWVMSSIITGVVKMYEAAIRQNGSTCHDHIITYKSKPLWTPDRGHLTCLSGRILLTVHWHDTAANLNSCWAFE